MALEVLEALDSVRTQLNHITAIIIARMGFFTDAYTIFCISTISKLLGRLYYTITGVALIGTLIGHLFFGWIGDKLSRKKAYSVNSHHHFCHMLRLVLRCKQRNCCQNTLFLQVLARAWYRWRLSHLGRNRVRVLQQKHPWGTHHSRVCNARSTNYIRRASS
ncbi:putative inorganic phosphate transporter 1-3 [Quercus suber]|uniref:Inorganic phosphate transporter 1-3 n=1 Tax=Quercus suber TaxID=58331 RepID=A0AAW0KCN4_QUESU